MQVTPTLKLHSQFCIMVFIGRRTHACVHTHTHIHAHTRKKKLQTERPLTCLLGALDMKEIGETPLMSVSLGSRQWEIARSDSPLWLVMIPSKANLKENGGKKEESVRWNKLQPRRHGVGCYWVISRLLSLVKNTPGNKKEGRKLFQEKYRQQKTHISQEPQPGSWNALPTAQVYFKTKIVHVLHAL